MEEFDRFETTFGSYIADREIDLNNPKDIIAQFFVMSGLRPDDQIVAFEGYGRDDPRKRKVPEKGWSMFFDVDDFSVAIYKDQVPISAMYLSYRGSLHQAGAFFAEPKNGGQFWYVHNMPGLFGRSGYVDTWEPSGESSICVQVAYEWLIGKELSRQEERTCIVRRPDQNKA